MDTQVADPLLGTLVDGRYRIRGRVARGGMATVYVALDERLERTVACKIIQPGQAARLDRFADEAKTIARLTHPNVVAVYDQGTHAGLPYLVMEYVRGRTLRDVLAERRRLNPVEALAVMEQILAALAAAHRAGLVHRDVKPENVLISEAPGGGNLVDAVVKVADFGLARAVEASAEDPNASHLMATVAYVSPELVSDGQADPRSDVYSAGIMLFEMLTGRVPYDGERPVDVAWQHVDRDVPAPSRLVAGLPPVLDELVGQATRRNPAHRPTDAGALLSSVQAAREQVTTAGAMTQRMRPIEQPTIIVSQVQDRPSWARLPSNRPQPRPQAEAAGFLERVTAWFHHVRANPRGRMTLTALIVVLALFIVVGGWWLAFGRYDAAPELVAKSRTAAEKIASDAGLTVRIGEGRFDEKIAKDTVLEQTPKPGDRVLKGGEITLILSLGPERYEVPDIIGKSLQLATVDLTAEPLRLKVVKGTDRYDDVAPAGTVIETDPKVGTPVKPGDTIKLIVSKGRAPITVPPVTGKPLAEARATLEGLGLVVVITYVKNEEKARDTVLTQNPASGSGVEKGAQIKLEISEGPAGGGMPDVRNMGCSAATQHLQSLGLNVEVEGGDLDRQWGQVKRQHPGPGEPIQQGGTAKITCKMFG